MESERWLCKTSLPARAPAFRDTDYASISISISRSTVDLGLYISSKGRGPKTSIARKRSRQLIALNPKSKSISKSVSIWMSIRYLYPYLYMYLYLHLYPYLHPYLYPYLYLHLYLYPYLHLYLYLYLYL